jgi:outer membrane protein assembly factor BamB
MHKSILPLVIGSSAFLMSATHAADWPRWRGPEANGISQETGWKSVWKDGELKTLWKAEIGIGFATMSVANGKVYAMGNLGKSGNKDVVYCLDAGTGAEVWKFSYECKLDPNLYEGGPSATPTVEGDRVYTLSKEGHFFCFNAANGALVWSNNVADVTGAKRPDWGFASSPYIDGDVIVLNAGTAGSGFDKNTGRMLWCSGKEKAGYATAVPFGTGDSRCLLIESAAILVAIKPDGTELWRHPWKTQYGGNIADPVVVGDRIFLSSGYKQGAGLVSVTNGKPVGVWANKNMQNHLACSVYWNGFVYGVDESQLRCIDPNTGDVKWTEPSTGKGTLMMADGKLIILSEKGELIIAGATSEAFKPLSRQSVLTGKCWTAPVLANGRIYCRNATGTLVCVDVKGN